ncbi:MAG: caspase family protein [Nitrospirae bacterium]|nr:caspase family protein [Nitrospirota bacterium]
MYTRRRLLSVHVFSPIIAALLTSACVPYIPPPALTVPAGEQEVPVVLAVGPIDTTKVTHDGAPASEFVEGTIQETIKNTLSRTQIFKDVAVLKLPAQAGKALDAEQVLAAARAQKADLLLVGEVKEFEADVPVWLFGSRYDVALRFQAQLYNVHTGGLIWKKTEKVTVARDGSGIKRQESLDAIVRYVVVPSVTAGILPPLVEHLQTEYLASLKSPGKGRVTAEASTVFGGAELAKIDAELAPPASKVAPKDHAYAVIIGIEDYRDLPKVDYAKRDAEMVKQYLIKALGYREQNIVMMLNDNATRSRLKARLEKWIPKQVAEHPNSEVFVYYGGHGAPDPNTNQAFLVPYDGDPAFLEETGYSLKELYKALGDLPATQVTVVMDSCFSGSGGRSVIAKGTRPMLIKVENPLLAAQNVVVLSAAAGNQISSAFPEKRHGLFTYYFLKGLQGEADFNKDGGVDVEELYSYIKPQVELAARRMNAEQSPQLLPGMDLLGDRAKLRLIDLQR